MSFDNVIAFGKMLSTSPKMLEEIQTQCNDMVEIVAMGQREGFRFSTQELSEYLEAVKDQPAELTDEELEQVAGGIPGSDGHGFTYGCTGDPKFEINGIPYCSGG